MHNFTSFYGFIASFCILFSFYYYINSTIINNNINNNNNILLYKLFIVLRSSF